MSEKEVGALASASAALTDAEKGYSGGGGHSAHFSSALDAATTTTRKSTLTSRQIRRRQSGYGISISSDSTAKMRCKMRKMYFLKRNKVCDFSLLLGLLGLILVVIDSELTALDIISKSDGASWALRGACVTSTALLIWTLIDYHRIEVKIALIDSGADDWRVAVTTERLIKLSIEIAICMICPFPGSGSINWPNISTEHPRISTVQVPLDVLLSVPMFLRSYLLCRFMVLHSKQFQDAATRSIAALNRISMDFRFVIKTMMADHPLTVLVVFTVSYWICMSWMFTQCERYNNKYTTEHYYMNSLWFIMVTFMSIGYGDVVPNSYCGRLLSITTGIVGAGVSSALIAVISRKLELSRAEKHVNNFMADSKLTNQRKNAAASVLQHTWFIHKYQRSAGKGDELRLRQHQRKFLNAINDFRRIKWDQRKLQERGNSLLDVGKLHNEMHETLWEMYRTQDQFIAQIDMLTQRIVDLQAAVLGGQIVVQNANICALATAAAAATTQTNNNNNNNNNNNMTGGIVLTAPPDNNNGKLVGQQQQEQQPLQTHLLVPQQQPQIQQQNTEQQHKTPKQQFQTQQQQQQQQQLLSVVVVPDNNNRKESGTTSYIKNNNVHDNQQQNNISEHKIQQQQQLNHEQQLQQMTPSVQPHIGTVLAFDTKPITLITRKRKNMPCATISEKSADFAMSLSKALSTLAAADKVVKADGAQPLAVVGAAEKGQNYDKNDTLTTINDANSATCQNIANATLCRQSATLQSGSPQSILSASRTPLHSPQESEGHKMLLNHASGQHSAKRYGENEHGSASDLRASASTESDDCCSESALTPLITRETSAKHKHA